ncbi:hypothetical protein P691DRAFT_706120 [Macrolepiota fuliginosa MF-IS2]|uniref:DRBM domain-containing protein n=1 Tax=Macrolepiota fuliginosa MF-IS2 TaxID=1400762 RepID=A0A9P5XDZ4_9AGAR|nr:hypothetical protein P691DRAFT_706120 [Macrolepiota fuliginosa MF-IS2]
MHAFSSTSSGAFPSPSLKRTRSGELSRPPGDIPHLPDITNDLVLEVYAHESLRPPDATKPEAFTDNTRLAQFGKKVLDTAVFLVLFQKKPFLSLGEIENRKEELLDDDTVQRWVNSYQLARRIRCAPEYRAKMQTPEECRRVFCAYVGAVFRDSGQEAVTKWLELLVQYHELQAPSAATASDIPPAKKIKNEPTSSSLTSFRVASPTLSSSSSVTASSHNQPYSPTSPYLNTPSQSYPSAHLARQAPPHMSKPSSYQAQQSPQLSQFSQLFQSLATLSQSRSLQAMTGNQSQRTQLTAVDGKSPVSPKMPSPAGRPNPLAPATPNAPFLPMFNQTASQRGVKVDYQAEFSGPSHAGQWTVQCIVNGIRKGEGKGSSKQIAKEEAARQAYYSMGWT